MALVTDVDAGVEGERGVSQDEVFAVFAQNIERLRRLLLASVATVPVARSCSCPSTLDRMTPPLVLP